MSTSDEPTKFAYWVPNVSGGLVTGDIEQRTHWSSDRFADTVGGPRRPCSPHRGAAGREVHFGHPRHLSRLDFRAARRAQVADRAVAGPGRDVS